MADGVKAQIRRFSVNGTWDWIQTHLLAQADAAGDLDWDASVDSTINRAHQQARVSALPFHGKPQCRI